MDCPDSHFELEINKEISKDPLISFQEGPKDCTYAYLKMNEWGGINLLFVHGRLKFRWPCPDRPESSS